MNKLELRKLSDILAQSYNANWLVEDFLEKESVTMLFGEPGTYKSFLAMDLAFCVGAGIDWNGRLVAKGKVIYLAGEGFSGIQKRFRALEDKYGRSQKDVFISSKSAELIDFSSVDEVLNAIDNLATKPVLIIIDTMHRNFGSGDESSSRDFGVFMKHLDSIKNHTKATILFIHHPGHGGKGHGRGSSAIRASLDAEYQLKKQGDGVELVCNKMKEFKEPETRYFELKQVTVKVPTGTANSAYLKMVVGNSIPNKPNRGIQVLDCLQKLIKSKGIPVPISVTRANPQLKGKYWVKTEDWRHKVYSDLAQELPSQSSRQTTFKRYQAKSVSNGKVLEVGDFSVIL